MRQQRKEDGGGGSGDVDAGVRVCEWGGQWKEEKQVN
jgi:hypothetical protein